MSNRTNVVAEIGQNHSGSLDTALKLMLAAAEAGADYVKFQKRTPELCVPKEQWDIRRSTPWGEMTYFEYRELLELSRSDYEQIDVYSRTWGIPWFGSAWDIPSVDFLLEFQVPYIKIPSAKLTDNDLLEHIARTGVPSILSTGMSTYRQIEQAVDILGNPVILHCTSTYPCPPEELNLNVISELINHYPLHTIGYSGHEVGLSTTVAAVALGAEWVERHITLDRSSWGTDQAASVEPLGFKRLVDYIRTLEKAMGDGVKKVEEGELEPMARLRG